jgi:hypothetical protein
MGSDTTCRETSSREIERLIPPFHSRERYSEDWTSFRELHLYNGSRCNRECAFCVVAGSPQGWYQPFTEAVLDAALRLVTPDGNLKFYGGEPTLDPDNLRWAVRYLRAEGFQGWFTLFTNGVLACRLTRLLDADPWTEAVLNYSILYGRGAKPLPRRALAHLLAYAQRRPGILFSSHSDLVPVGPGAAFQAAEPRPAFGAECPQCPPVLTTDGRLHACPFAVELDHPHYRLGTIQEGGAAGMERWLQFRAWIDTTLMPQARAQCRHPCTLCTGHQLPITLDP